MDLKTLAFLSLLCLPLVPPLFLARRRTALARRELAARRRHVRRATAADAAVARVVTASPEFSGNTLQLPCRECGRRAVPPVDHVDSPPIPFERAGLVPLARGFVITATCTACAGPLISRVLDEEHAERCRALGVIDGESLEASLRDWLATI